MRNGGTVKVNISTPPRDLELFTEQQAAAYLQILPRTVRLWRITRGLPFIRISGKTVRFRRNDIEGWLAKHRVATVG